MSAHSESLHTESIDDDAESASAEEQSEYEFKISNQDSLILFGVAVGGGVLGVLLTLLLLALINGGTLNFSQVERIAALEAAHEALSGNVEANTQNIDTVANRTTADISALLGTAEQQGGDIDTLTEAVDAMSSTSEDLDILVSALSGALDQIEAPDSESADSEPAAADGAETAVAAAGEPVVESAVSVPVGDVEVILFVDENGNGTMDPGESNQPGITVSLLNADESVVATLESTDSGLVFENLEPGDYQLVLEDNGGYAALDGLDTSFSVPADAETGQILYEPLPVE